MQRKYAGQGLDAISVNLDDVSDKKIPQKVKSFLDEKGAAFTNVIFNGDQDVLADKMGVEGLPTVFVFGRDGKVAKQYKDGEGYTVIEKFVVELLKQ